MSESLRRELSDLRNRDMAATQVRVAPLLRRSTLGRGAAAVARAAESASRVYCGAKHTPSHSFILNAIVTAQLGEGLRAAGPHETARLGWPAAAHHQRPGSAKEFRKRTVATSSCRHASTRRPPTNNILSLPQAGAYDRAESDPGSASAGSPSEPSGRPSRSPSTTPAMSPAPPPPPPPPPSHT